jgi:hypothetical protein
MFSGFLPMERGRILGYISVEGKALVRPIEWDTMPGSACGTAGEGMLAMISEHEDDTPRFGGVRRSVWTLLIAAVLLALAVPTVTIWHAAHASITARAYVWPAAPTVGHPAELCVVVSDATDRAAVHGPWGQIVAAWDMPTMQMQAQRQAQQGDSATGAYAIPLTLEMAGAWRVQVALQTPGRPEWQTSLAVLVRDASPTPPPTATTTNGAASSSCSTV